MSQPVTIRRAVARDAKRLTRLVRGSGAYEGKYAAAVAGYRVGPDYIEAHRAFVAVGADEHGGRVLGFYSLVLAPPELDLLFVADEAQGRGIGRLLVAHMQSEARAAGIDRLKVVSHLPAEDFYHRVGAVRCGPGPRSLTRPPCRGTVLNSSFAFLRNDAVCRLAGHRLRLHGGPTRLENQTCFRVFHMSAPHG